MASSYETALSEALHLPEDSRMALVERILASFEPQAAVTESHLDLVRRRKREIDSGQVLPIAGGIVAAEVRQAIKEARGQ